MHAGGGYRGGARPTHPIAGRPGRPGYAGGYYPGRRYGYGAAAVGVGAAAAGAAYYGSYGYYNNGCYRDTYGRTVCPPQY
jgi:hypothetical protein